MSKTGKQRRSWHRQDYLLTCLKGHASFPALTLRQTMERNDRCFINYIWHIEESAVVALAPPQPVKLNQSDVKIQKQMRREMHISLSVLNLSLVSSCFQPYFSRFFFASGALALGDANPHNSADANRTKYETAVALLWVTSKMEILCRTYRCKASLSRKRPKKNFCFSTIAIR